MNRKFLSSFLGLFLALSSFLSSKACEAPLGLAKTRSGLDPQQFFAQNKTLKRSRFLMTVGLPGSGKSSWIKEAEDRGWRVINADELRVERLRLMRKKGESLNLGNGRVELADPQDSSHVFSEALRGWAYEVAAQLLDEALKSGENVVWDATNLDQYRLPKIFQARAAGYSVEALIFVSSDIHKNERNIALRAQEGGLDLAQKDKGDAPTERLRILKYLQSLEARFPIRHARLAPLQFENPEPLPANLENPGPALRRFDVFNRMDFVQVEDWSRPSP